MSWCRFTKLITIINVAIISGVFCQNGTWPRQSDFEEYSKNTINISERSGRSGERLCQNTNGTIGACRDFVQCPVLLNQLRSRHNDPQFVQFIRESNRVCQENPPVICCPLENSQVQLIPGLPTPQNGCGSSTSYQEKIVGGRPSKIGAWPWVALLLDTEGRIKCGGFLITTRHVLTAAHCLVDNLRVVRFGDHDLTTDSEAEHLDVEIERVVKHPNFNRNAGKSDIGIVYLNRDITFTDRIKPICLPLSGMPEDQYVGRTPFVAGWGQTTEGGDSSKVLREAQITVFDNSVCKDSFVQLGRRVTSRQFDDAIICAGELAGGKGTCAGDSGSPLMGAEMYDGKIFFHAIGIVSYSIGCARSNVPDIFTNVAYFIDWIKDRVAERSTF